MNMRLMGDDLKIAAHKKQAINLKARYGKNVGVGQESKKLLPAGPEVNPQLTIEMNRKSAL